VKIADASHNLSKAHLITDPTEQEQLRNKYASALEFLGVDPIQAEVPLVFCENLDFTGWIEKGWAQANKPPLHYTKQELGYRRRH